MDDVRDAVSGITQNELNADSCARSGRQLGGLKSMSTEELQQHIADLEALAELDLLRARNRLLALAIGQSNH